MRSVSSIEKSAQTTALIVLSLANLFLQALFAEPARAESKNSKTPHATRIHAPHKAAARDEIQSLHADITVTPDASLKITEVIDANFAQPHHGIERFIPLRSSVQGVSRQIFVDVDRNGITCDGKTVQSDVSYPGGKVQLKIGHPDVLLKGTHRYELSYLVRNAINESKGKPELYWNAIGTEWKVPINNASATVHFPIGTTGSALKSNAFRGFHGSKQPALVTKGTDLKFHSSALLPGEGLTIAVQMPEHTVEIPNKISLWLFAVQQTMIVGAALFFASIGMWWVALPLIALFLWRQANSEPLEWTSSGGSCLDFGSTGDAFGGGGGDFW